MRTKSGNATLFGLLDGFSSGSPHVSFPQFERIKKFQVQLTSLKGELYAPCELLFAAWGADSGFSHYEAFKAPRTRNAPVAKMLCSFTVVSSIAGSRFR